MLRRSRLELPRPIQGEELITFLEDWSNYLGARFDYIPVLVSVSGVSSSERKVFEQVALNHGQQSIHIEAENGLIEKGKGLSTLVIEGDMDDELIGTVLLHLRRLDDPPVKKAIEVERLSIEPEGRRARRERKRNDRFVVLVVTQGAWSRRILEHVRKKAPGHWAVVESQISAQLPNPMDDLSGILPMEVPAADLLLLLSEHPSAPQLIPDLLVLSGATAVISPIDNGSWFPQGEASKLAKLLQEQGVPYAFPRPFCALKETGDPIIDEFVKRFGSPMLEIESVDGMTVSKATVVRGAPCGCTDSVAEGLLGARLEEAIELSGLKHHHFPCLASMSKESELDDTLMHLSGLELKRRVEEEVKRFRRTKPSYILPGKA
jgi:thymidylate synthase